MLLRCPECGYENRQQYRFCGMCGAELPAVTAGSEAPSKPQHAAPPGPTAPPPSPATEGSRRSLDYLLEDEPHPRHGRMYVALALLVVAGLLLAWHWHREGYPWAEGPAAATGDMTSPAPAATPAAPAPKAGTSPAPTSKPEPQQAPQSAPANAPGEVAKGESNPEAQGGTQPPAAGAASAPPAAPLAKPAEPTQSQDAETAGNERVSSGSAAGQEQPGAATAGSAEAADSVPAPAPKPSAPEVKQPATSGTPEDRLVAEGEKYLYGDGVPQNCARAQRNLTSAARRLNVKAQSLLGTMYATGHCAQRDLPTAYRWFAKALHQDPTNDRIQRDLEALWREMTPDERQIAMRNQ